MSNWPEPSGAELQEWADQITDPLDDKLAALPPDWCGHDPITSHRECVESIAALKAEYEAEIARLRAALEEVEDRLDTLYGLDDGPKDDPERWAMAVWYSLEAARAALDAKEAGG